MKSLKPCPKCKGTGVIYDRTVQAGSHGELRLCDCIEKKCACGSVPPYQVFDSEGNHAWCECRAPRIRLENTRKAFRDAEIPRKYLWKFREDFKIVKPEANRIIGSVGTIDDKNFDEKWNVGFYLWGPAGSGKTLLAAIILQELMLKYGQRGRFIDLSRQFFQRLKQSYDVSDESYGSAGRILEDLIAVPFLVIDDFGVQRNTEWESETLYNLIDSRYSEERIIIVTSNCTIDEYKKIAQGRIYSRIIEMCTSIHVNLPDYRETLKRNI